MKLKILHRLKIFQSSEGKLNFMRLMRLCVLYALTSKTNFSRLFFMPLQARKISADLAFANEKYRVVHNKTSFSTSVKIASKSYGSETERTDTSGRQNLNKHLQFLVRLNYSFAVNTRLPS